MIYALELMGVAAFAASGVAASRAKRPDLIGAMILAFATALGGGIIRDAILGVPAQTFRDGFYFAAILFGAGVALRAPRMILRLGSTLRVADAIGLGLFNASGMMKAYESGEVSPVFAVVLGTITGTGGGIIRDVLCNEMPALLRPGELYVTTCIAGGLAGLAALALGADPVAASGVIAGVTIGFRLLAIRYNWKLEALRGVE
ncbi:MAG: hypothetical protein DCC71_25370 [Proteobacteria bacterium]|nr:MAG: hypothetical protein DCC71_25370 [Pseudomonadota bacterium]